MDQEYTDKPRITMPLNPVLESYCRFIFNTPAENRHIELSRKTDIGKLIFAHVMSGDFAPKTHPIKYPVTFILPLTGGEHGYWLRNRHIYLPRWAEDKIQDGIEYEFRCWVKDRFRIGYEDYNLDQQTIINAILRGMNVRNNAVNFDMIKKIDYRNRRRKAEIQFRNLISAEVSGK